MGCCDDPTEPKKLDRRDLIRLQERYDELVCDLLTVDPEKVILKLVDSSSSYLIELAALNAHHPSVRLRAIGLLGQGSAAVLQKICQKEPGSQFELAARARLATL